MQIQRYKRQVSHCLTCVQCIGGEGIINALGRGWISSVLWRGIISVLGDIMNCVGDIIIIGFGGRGFSVHWENMSALGDIMICGEGYHQCIGGVPQR